MNRNELLVQFSAADERLILAAEKMPQRKKRKIMLSLGAAAVAVAAVITIALARQPAAQLPQLTISDSQTGGMGFEGFHVNELSELEGGNPWRADMNLKTMPVFRSSSTNPDPEKMKRHLKEVAERFGVTLDDSEIVTDFPDVETYRTQMQEYGASEEETEELIARVLSYTAAVRAKKNGFSFQIDSAFTVGIHFDEPIPTPDEYASGYHRSLEEAERLADYLLSEYRGFLSMKDPQKNIYSELGFQFYDKGGSDAETIVNFSLNNTRLCTDDNGDLFVIWAYSNDGCEKIGDYPIISAEEAKTLLVGGNYLSSLDYRITGEEEIAKTELVYRSGIGYETVMPFYRFLVEVNSEKNGQTAESADGKRLFAAFYVPAVRGEYLTDLPAQISFNGSIIK